MDRCRTAAPSFDERAARSRRVSRRQQHRDYGLSDDTLAMPRLMGLGKRALIHRGANRHMTEGKNILGGAAPSWLDYTPLLPTAYSDSYEEPDGDDTNPKRYCTAIR